LQVLGESSRRASRPDFAADTMHEGADVIDTEQVQRGDTSPEIPTASDADIEAAFGGAPEDTDPEAPNPLADQPQAEPGPAVRVSVDDHAYVEGDTLDSGPIDEEVEPTDWKIKAPPGLTYNFHSLDAMLGWAANKSGLDMKVSIDGEEWHDFESFLEAIRAGLPPMRALRLAAEGGEVSARIAAIKEAPQLSAFDEIQQVDVHEEVRQLFSGNLDEDEDEDEDWESVEVIDDTLAATEQEEAREEAKADAVPAPSAAHRLQPPVSPAPSRRLPAVKMGAAVEPKRLPTGQVKKTPLAPRGKARSAPVLIAIVLVVLVAAAAAVHFTGVYRIPGLPF
jgi:hypothetical protein